MIQWNNITLFQKKGCLACALIRKRMNELNVPYEVKEAEGSAPVLKVGATIFLPPISTKYLKVILDKYGKRVVE